MLWSPPDVHWHVEETVLLSILYEHELLWRQKVPAGANQPEYALTGGCWPVIGFWSDTHRPDVFRVHRAWKKKEETGFCCYSWDLVSLVPAAIPLRDGTSCTTSVCVTLSLPLTEMLCQIHFPNASPVCSPEGLSCSFSSGNHSPHLQLHGDNPTSSPYTVTKIYKPEGEQGVHCVHVSSKHCMKTSYLGQWAWTKLDFLLAPSLGQKLFIPGQE